ncbi:hypothetical protein FCM35_KLT09565 [Carex littledalei]|uniref:Uncharacterized protein n=1 Tax=Carex littledalei TaxID=544730 RepID=A0A833VJZ5_9POAL|nr:hypothetical protein FCM35_KLT09565 [Carex littledalei]
MLPGWMMDPFSLESIQKVSLKYCDKIQSLPFGNLHTLKHLKIEYCYSIRVLQLEQLPSQLEELVIYFCDHLESITGLGNLDTLSTLNIYSFKALKSLTMDGLHFVESTKSLCDSSHEKPHINRHTISSLTMLEIKKCNLLCVLPDAFIPSGPCYVRVLGCGCPDLKRN